MKKKITKEYAKGFEDGFDCLSKNLEKVFNKQLPLELQKDKAIIALQKWTKKNARKK